MAWESKGRPKVMLATRRVAAEWSEMPEAREDRPLSERRLGAYRKMVADRAFRPVTWAKAFCKETGQHYRVNGKHTSTLFASLDPKELDGLVVVIEEYDCDTLEDVARLYGTFDSRVQIRTGSDINVAFAATVPELRTMPMRFINLVVGALAMDAKPTCPFEGTPQDRAERLFDNVAAAVWLRGVIDSDSSHRHIARVPVMGAMVTTFRRSQKDAATFWLAVRDETGEAPSLPDRKIARFLLGTNVNTGRGASAPLSRRADAREIYAKCVTAWNAWRKGAETDLKYYADKDIPVAK